MATTTVNVKQGTLKGAVGESFKGDKFVKFLGIPYAKPPVGELRFKAPEPTEPWIGERDATEDGNSSYSLYSLVETVESSENCLFLNVFTRNLPKGNNSQSNLKPVMVYIHGGAFTMGSGNTQETGPEVLMQKDIVLVAINYRLGLLGFLSLDDASLDVPGNAGLKDQILALKWVQENIRSFGGNPDNVTIFGLSAGGASVHLLVLSPAAKGLFHKAIALSGSAVNPWAWGSRNAKEVAKLLGKEVRTEKEALDILVTATADQLIQAQIKIPDNICDASKVRPFGPVVERPNPTAFITKEPRDIMESGEYNQVPLMTGFTSREGFLLGAFADQLPKGDPSRYFVPFDLSLTDEQSDLFATKLRERYLNAADGVYDLASDVLFVNGIIESVETHVKNSSQPIYIYQNSMENKLGIMKDLFDVADKAGVGHGDDLALFLHMRRFPRDCEPGSREEKASDRLVNLLVNFAKYGDPTPSEEELGVKWTPVSGPDHLDYLDFGDELIMKVNPFADRMEFWRRIYSKKNSKKVAK